MIELHAVAKVYDAGRTPAVRDVDLTVAAGETVAFVGSSGSGKSTTLKMINRLIDPSAGVVRVRGRDVKSQPAVWLRRSIGYVFQGIGLFPHLTVRQNVELVPRLSGWPRARRDRRTAEVLDLVELPSAEYASRYPAELSGGQQQRVGIARALAADPDCVLMDEPFGALDAITRRGLQQKFAALQRRLARTIVLVTHDVGEAELLADRIAVFHAGGIEQVGPAAELRARPATAFVEALFASSPAAAS